MTKTATTAFALLCGGFTLLAGLACAQANLPLSGGNAGAPVDISAAQSLEWNSRDKTYTARKDVIVKQGDMEVRSDVLTAHYSDDAGSASISRLVAETGVIISAPPYTGHGDKAVYDTIAQKATLTGANLRIATPTETLTAQDSIIFDMAAQQLVARGNATAQRGSDSLSSKDLSAFFTRDAAGKTTLDKIIADHPVTIKTARETVTGNKGVYDVTAGKATLTGDVRIKQGESWISGTRAEVDLKTGISRLFAEGTAGDGRVRGVFYPKKQGAE